MEWFMHYRETVQLAFESIYAHRIRSLLTMLGLIIGVASVILLVSLGNGAKQYIFNEFQSIGTNLIIVQPGKTDKKNSFGPPIGVAQRKMTVADVDALERLSFNLEAVTGLLFGTTTIRFEESISNVSVFGSNEQFIRVLNLSVAEGSFFTKEEDDSGRRVVVLGSQVAKDLFSDGNAVGRKVRVSQTEYRVIGVMQETGAKLGLNLDEFVFLPTHAALRLFNDDKLFGIRAKAKSKVALDDAVEEIREILKTRRDGEEDFTIITQDSMMQSMDTILSMLSYVLGGIACISMLVAGIGIMNIMLVSVAERTQEIGIRRAVGARRRDIAQQFITEAACLSLCGGLFGVILAAILSQVAYWYLPSFDLRAPYWIILPAFGFSMLIGLVFGVWPARRAARIETLEALRYE
jgi:putative ABC transport system permease protein